MWKEAQNETHCTMYQCRVSNFKQYLKAIKSLYKEDCHGWIDNEYGIYNWSYEDWHIYFGTRYVNWDDELYDEDSELPSPNKFKCEEGELELEPMSYPAILVWNCDYSELSIF